MRDRLRILMPNLEYPPLGGGAAPVTRGLARALVAQGHQVDVVTMSYRGLPAEADDHGVHVYRVPGLRSRLELSRVHELATYIWSGYRKVRALAKATAYDICHCHFILPTAVIPYLLRRSSQFPPYLVTSHGSDVPRFNPDRFTMLHRITPPFIRPILRHSAGIIVPSAALEQLIRAQFGPDLPPMIRIANGVDLERFIPRQKESKILVASRLFERKGVQHVLEAFAAIEQCNYSIEIAGDGPQLPQLRRQSGEHSIPARFHGWLAEEPLTRLFEESRIFVLASSSDNFPVSLLEAMAARCAVITTRAGGCPEVVGDTGLVVEPGDVTGLKSALNRLVQDPAYAEALGARAARRVHELFGWKAIASMHEKAYETALKQATSFAGAGEVAASA
jgi:glycosyltransferase involved in cell wall biosynthesis